MEFPNVYGRIKHIVRRYFEVLNNKETINESENRSVFKKDLCLCDSCIYT